MKRNNGWQILAGLFVVLVTCTLGFAQDVKYNYAPGTDFSKYKTYKWVEVEGGERPNQITDGQIRDAVGTQMTQKGFTKSETETADLFISYQVAISQQQEWTAMGGPGIRWGGMGTATSSTINVGTLALDVYDASTKKLLWTGDATKTLNPSKDPEKNLQNLQKGIAKLMKNFPPPVKK